MKYCSQCGTTLDDTGKFCHSCGAAVEISPAQKQAVPSVKQPMSKKNKKLFLLAGIAIVALFAAFKLTDTFTSKERLINNFEKAIIENDSGKAASLLSSSDKRMAIDKNSVQGLIKYLSKNPKEEKQLFNDLQSQSTYLDIANGKNQTALAHHSSKDVTKNKFVNLKDNGQFLFFHIYKLQVSAVFITIETNYNNTALYVDGKNIGKSTKYDFNKTYGPFVTGIHTVEGKLKTNFADLAKKNTLEAISGKNTDSLYLNGQDLRVNLPTGDDKGTAKLFINGKDVGVNLFKDPTYGPITTNGSMKMSVEAALPWGIERSDVVPITKNRMNVNLIPNVLKQTIMDITNREIDEELDAVTSGDVNRDADASEEYKNGLNDSDPMELGAYINTISHTDTKFDLDSFGLDYSGDNWYVFLNLEDDMSFEPTYEGKNSFPVYMEYGLYYDETTKKWLVDKSRTISDISRAHVKEYNNDNPTVYNLISEATDD